MSQGGNIAGDKGNLGPQQTAGGVSFAAQQLDRHGLSVRSHQAEIHDVVFGKTHVGHGDIGARPTQHEEFSKLRHALRRAVDMGIALRQPERRDPRTIDPFPEKFRGRAGRGDAAEKPKRLVAAQLQ